MRINNPKLFNGDLLATKRNVNEWLSQVIPANQDFAGFLKTDVIPIVGLSSEFDTTLSANVFPVYAETIKLGKADETTIKDAIDAITSSVAAVTVYDVDAAANHAISITPSSWVSEEIPHKKFTVDLTLDGNSLTQSASGLKITNGYVEGIASGITRELEIVKLAGDDVASGNIASRYELQFNGVRLGETIEIVKDQFLSGVEFIEGTGSGDDKLEFTFITSGGAPNVVDIPLSGLFNEYTAGPGIDVKATATGLEISGVVDPTSDSYLTVGATGFKLSGVSAAIVDLQAADEYISGKVDELSGKVASVDKFIKVADFPASGETDKEALYYTDEGQSKIWNDNSWQTISMEALTEITAATANNTTTATSLAIKTYVDNTVSNASGAVLDQVEVLTGAIRSELSGVSGTLEGEIQYVSGAVTGAMADLESVSGTLENEIQYVSGVVSGHTEDIEYISGVVSGINTRKVELFETEISATQAGDFQDTITGRVIAVYDANMNQVYPDINYNKSNGVSTITISGLTAAEVFTVIYTTTTAQNPNA